MFVSAVLTECPPAPPALTALYLVYGARVFFYPDDPGVCLGSSGRRKRACDLSLLSPCWCVLDVFLQNFQMLWTHIVQPRQTWPSWSPALEGVTSRCIRSWAGRRKKKKSGSGSIWVSLRAFWPELPPCSVVWVASGCSCPPLWWLSAASASYLLPGLLRTSWGTTTTTITTITATRTQWASGYCGTAQSLWTTCTDATPSGDWGNSQRSPPAPGRYITRHTWMDETKDKTKQVLYSEAHSHQTNYLITLYYWLHILLHPEGKYDALWHIKSNRCIITF